MNKRARFRAGFRRALPLWAGALPFGIVYAVTARGAGFSPVEIQVMSLLIYSAPAQLSLVTLSAAGAPVLSMLLTAVILNVHHVLYGMSLAERLTLSPFQRALAAFFLTDSVYGLAMAEGEKVDGPFLAGVEASVFFAWNFFTAVGLWLGDRVVNLGAWHLEFIAPLTFAVLLAATLKTRQEGGVALLAVGLALVCILLQAGNLTLPVAVITAAFVGAWQRQPKIQSMYGAG